MLKIRVQSKDNIVGSETAPQVMAAELKYPRWEIGELLSVGNSAAQLKSPRATDS